MRISWKLAIILVIMVIPVITSVGFFYVRAQEDVDQIQQERRAMAYVSGLIQIIEFLPQHRGTAQGFLSGDRGQRTRLEGLRAQVDQAFQGSRELNDLYGGRLRVTASFQEIEAQWEQLKSDFEAGRLNPGNNFDRHTEIIDNINRLFFEAAQGGQLIGDPEADSSYLINVMVERIPDAVETLGQLRGRGNGIAARGSFLPGEQLVMERLLARTVPNVDAINRNILLAEETNPDLTVLEGARASVEQAAGTFLGSVRGEILGATEMSIVPTVYFDQGTAAISGYLEVFRQSADAVETLFDARERSLSTARNIQLAFALLLTLLAIGVGYLVQSNITRQTEAFGRLFSQIGIGDFESRVEVTSNDELGDLAVNLNSMLDNTLVLIQSQADRDQIQGSIQKLLLEISDAADGDLRVEAEVTNEVTGAIADSFNLMIGQLRDIINDVQETTLQVSSAASEIQATTEHLASGSEAQSEQIVNTSAAVDEMAVSIQQVSDNAASAASVAEQALDNARQGNEAVGKTIHGMNGIRQQVQETAKRIKRLGESSQEIGEIVQLIGDIADRTSILALNASIQAAMAGEAGRGFAVVAEEVERLADRSAEATKRIEGLIKTIQSETTEAVAAMEDTTREVVSGSGVANEAGQALEEIGVVSNRLAELISSISMASKQQARGSDSVAKSMGDISEVTQQTAAGTKQAAVSIRNLAELADNLRESVRTFKLPEHAA